MHNTRMIVLVSSTAAALALVACEKGPTTPPPPEATTGASEDHEHAPNEEHDHEHGDGDEHHGEETPLGSQQIGGYDVAAALLGELEPGHETHVEIALSGGAAQPAAVRVWIGDQAATGAIKARAEAQEHGFHAHAETPDPLPQDARLWVEIETESGERSSGSFPLAG